MTITATKPTFYVAQLDGLRFVAFLAVFIFHVVFHVPPYLPLVPPVAIRWDSLEWWARSTVLAGAFGVDLFFVLSSFLITLLLVREADARGRINVPAFWMRRVLRIWPLYFVYVALCWLFEPELPLRAVAAFGLFVGNWPLVGPVSDRSLIGILWSVQVEEQFYLAWPLLLAVLPRRFLRLLCLGLIAGSLVYRTVILAGGGGVERIWIHTLARLDPIAIGALIALTWEGRRIPFGRTLKLVVGVAAPLLVVVSVGLLCHELVQPGPERGTLLIRPGWWHFIATILVFLVVAVSCGGVVLATLAARGSWLGHPLLVYLGRISYGLYVFHLASIRVVESLWWPWRCVLGLGISVLLASLSYRLLEQPFLRLKERFTYVSSAPSEGAVKRSPPVDAPKAGALSSSP